jgi:glycine cleavage system H protein
MGHDLITIYWLKAIEYILALSYLPLFVLFWRLVNPSPRAARAVAVQPPAPGWADQLREFFQLPAGLLFHPGHTWARVNDDDTVTIGIDAFARQLVGSRAAIGLPAVGDTLKQGAPGLALAAGGRRVEMLSPVDGTVVDVNPLVAEAPERALQAPYGEGWLVKVASSNRAANVRNLLSGKLARLWMDAACEKLGAELSPRELGPRYADGGVPVDGVLLEALPDTWDVVARRFFLTTREGRDA